MVRVAALIVAGLAVIAAAPARNVSPLSSPWLADATIAPTAAYPAAPDAPRDLSGFTAAPMPNADQAAPVISTAQPGEAQVSPNLFHGGSTYRGEGFVPGSSVQASQRRNIGPAPGVSLNVPLE